ncbi:MAG: T9SS type A sorting domain-containing protein [candidate division WOR-3 bacterium]
MRQEIDLSLYDVTGRLALSLAKGVYAPGSYEFRIEPHALSSGIYYLRLMSPEYRETRKLILTR